MLVKVFFSQKHKDRSADEITAKERLAMKKFKAAHPGVPFVEVPMLLPSQFKGQHPVYYLGMNLQMMCQADVVLFENDWWESRACCIQHEVCDQYGIPKVEIPCEIDDWDGK